MIICFAWETVLIKIEYTTGKKINLTLKNEYAGWSFGFYSWKFKFLIKIFYGFLDNLFVILSKFRKSK